MLKIVLKSPLFLNGISQKYSGKVATKCWADIRRAVNQKCNNIIKKMWQALLNICKMKIRVIPLKYTAAF